MAATLRVSSTVVIVTVIAGLWSLSVAERDDLYDEKVASLGTTASLNCNNSTQFTTAPNDSIPVSWMLPNLTVLYSNDGRFQILDSNWTLKIMNVSTEDLGLYHCMLQTPDVEWFLLRIGLNAGGPYFEDLWDKYWLNTVIGLSAFFGFLLLALVIIVIYHFRYREDDDDMTTKQYNAELAGDSHVAVVTVVDKSGDVNGAFDWDKKSPPSNEETSTSTSSSSESTTVVAETHWPVNDDDHMTTTQL